jgi:hypothetical protein
MSRKFLQELIKNLQELYKCPSCEQYYHMDDIKLLGEIDQYCFVQLTCHECSMPVLATVSLGHTEPLKRPKSDLAPRERQKFSHKGVITATEIAEFHRFITADKMSMAQLLQ